MENIIEKIINLINEKGEDLVIELCYETEVLSFQLFINEVEAVWREDSLVLQCEDSSSIRFKISSIKDIVYIEDIFDYYQISFSESSYLEIRSL